MGFERWNYHFDGAYLSPDELKSNAGVYVVWCKYDKDWSILDVGESDDVKWRLNNHERSDCWKKECSGEIYYSATYISDQDERISLEKKIRTSERVACGER